MTYFGANDFRDEGDEDDGPLPQRDRATVYLAHVLAQAAGMPWDDLSSHPGYYRNRWYELAQCTLARIDGWRRAEHVPQVAG